MEVLSPIFMFLKTHFETQKLEDIFIMRYQHMGLSRS
jgi:hypothetical protein